MTKTVKKEVQFHKKQFEAFSFKTQFGAAVAGVQSGKTFLGCYWAANNINTIKGDGLIGAPTYKILQQSTLQKFFQEFPQYRQFYKKQESVIDIPREDGTVKHIFLRSFDRPYGVEGITLHWAWLDEAGQMPEMAWTVIKSRVSTTAGRILITTTPYNMGWLFQKFYLPWKEKEDNRLSVFTWKSYENPFFSKEHYDAEKKALSPEEFSRRYEGEFTRMTGLVYELDQHNMVEREQMVFDKVIGGIDWGWNHMGISVIGIKEDGYYILDEWYETHKTTAEIIDAAKELQDTYKVSRWYADSANPEKIEEANRGTGLYVVGYKKKKDGISAGTSHIRQLINEHRLFLFDDLKSHRSEFESYHYPEELRPGAKEDPVKENDHLMDALRYAIMGDGPATRFQPTKKGWKKKSILSLEEQKDKKTVKYQYN